MAAPTSARPRLTRARAQREPEMGRWGSDQARRPRTHRRGRLREGRGGRSGGDGPGEGTRRRGAPSRACRPPAPPRPSEGLRAESPGNRFTFYVGKDIRVSGARADPALPAAGPPPALQAGLLPGLGNAAAEEPGRVRGQSVAGSRGCVCPRALGSPTAALTPRFCAFGTPPGPSPSLGGSPSVPSSPRESAWQSLLSRETNG